MYLTHQEFSLWLCCGSTEETVVQALFIKFPFLLPTLKLQLWFLIYVRAYIWSFYFCLTGIFVYLCTYNTLVKLEIILEIGQILFILICTFFSSSVLAVCFSLTILVLCYFVYILQLAYQIPHTKINKHVMLVCFL